MPTVSLESRAAALSLKQLYYLLAIRDTLNFTRAAEQCFVTQSSLSGGLAELESTLGLQLVERSRQHVAMTASGLAVCARAEQILRASEDLLGFARAQSDPASGTLRLGMIPTIAPYLLRRLLERTATDMPTLDLHVCERQTAALLDALNSGQLDAAVIALPVNTGSLRVIPLFADPLRLIASAQHPLAASRKPVSVRAVDAEEVILLEQGHCLREHTLSACAMAVREESRFEASSIDTLIQLTEANCGLALLPDMAVRSGLLEGTTVVDVTLAPPVPERGIALLTRASHPLYPFLETQIAPLLQSIARTSS